MINISDILYELSEDKNVYNKDYDLIENGVLDSFMFIELFYKLEELGYNIYPTRINREMLRTPRQIELLIKEYEKKDSK